MGEIVEFVRAESPAQRAVAEAFAEPEDAYAAFIQRNGRRPSPAEAVRIAEVVGRRVRADDGRVYPRLDRAQRAASRAAKRAEQAAWAVSWRLRNAIVALAQDDADETLVIELARKHCDDTGDITLNIDKAIARLNRFAQDWRDCSTRNADSTTAHTAHNCIRLIPVP